MNCSLLNRAYFLCFKSLLSKCVLPTHRTIQELVKRENSQIPSQTPESEFGFCRSSIIWTFKKFQKHCSRQVFKLDTTLAYRSLSPFWAMEKMFFPRSNNTTYFSIQMLKYRGSWRVESKISMSWVKSTNKPNKRKVSFHVLCGGTIQSWFLLFVYDIILIGNYSGFTSYWYKNLIIKHKKTQWI